jgi:hypothetical protein
MMGRTQFHRGDKMDTKFLYVFGRSQKEVLSCEKALKAVCNAKAN